MGCLGITGHYGYQVLTVKENLDGVVPAIKEKKGRLFNGRIKVVWENPSQRT